MHKKILIIGLGSIGRRHLSIAQQLLPEAQILVLRRENTRLTPSLGVTEIYSLDEAKRLRPEIIIISNAAPEHVNTAMEFIGMGANIFIEKPISDSTQEIVRLIHTLNTTGESLTLGYNLRYLNSLQEFRRYLNEGLIGKFLSVRCEVGQFLPNWRPEKDYRVGVSASRELGGGVLLELSHEIDYLRWLFGEVNWVRATLLRQSQLEIDVEDTVHLTIGFEERNSVGQLVANLNMDFIRHDATRSCTVIGDKGTLRWDGVLGEVSLFKPGESDWTVIFTKGNGIEDTYVLEWRELIRATQEKRSHTVTAEDGLRVIEIIEAARLSANNGIQTAVIRTPISIKDSK